MFEVRITAPELAEALNNLAAAISGRTGETLPVTTVRTDTSIDPRHVNVDPETGKAKAARSAAKSSPKTEPSTPATEEAQPEPTHTEAAEDEASASGEAEEATVDYAAVKKAVMDVSVKKGRAAAVALLAEFDVPEGQKADQIDEARWGEFVARAAEVLG